MKKQVNISVISKQFDGENTEQTEIMTVGEMKLYSDGYELIYDESEASGRAGSVTSVKVHNKSLVTLPAADRRIWSLLSRRARSITATTAPPSVSSWWA